METVVRKFHHILSDHLSVSEIGFSNQIPKEKLRFIKDFTTNPISYHKIETEFLDYGEHKFDYIWGNGISCLWENNHKRTCYYPWNVYSSVWNSAKLEYLTPIHKIVVISSNNQNRNIGVKIQASKNNVDWDTLYQISELDVKKMIHSPLELFFHDNTEYLYIRIVNENTKQGYDFQSIEVFSAKDFYNYFAVEYTLFYVLSGTVSVNGSLYQAPFGFLKRPQDSFNVMTRTADQPEIFWISFQGDQASSLLAESEFDSERNVFQIKSSIYMQYLNVLINDQIKEKPPESQLKLISQFTELLFIHGVQNELQPKSRKSQNEHVMRALQYIEDHRYENITLSDLTKVCSISEKHLLKIFKEQLGLPPIQYANKLRIEISKRLLRTTKDSIYQIAEQLNFNSPEYFCRIFRKEEHCSPSQYRKRHQKEN